MASSKIGDFQGTFKYENVLISSQTWHSSFSVYIEQHCRTDCGFGFIATSNTAKIGNLETTRIGNWKKLSRLTISKPVAVFNAISKLLTSKAAKFCDFQSYEATKYKQKRFYNRRSMTIIVISVINTTLVKKLKTKDLTLLILARVINS